MEDGQSGVSGAVTCGNGVNERSRSCINPAPQYEGNPCVGNGSDNKGCANPYCPGIQGFICILRCIV